MAELLDWSDGAKVIAAGPWNNPDAANNIKRGGVKVNCAICNSELVVFPASVEQAKQPNWHIIGRECCFPIIIESHEVRYCGRVTKNGIQSVTPAPIVKGD
jgi:hypothetical protein